LLQQAEQSILGSCNVRRHDKEKATGAEKLCVSLQYGSGLGHQMKNIRKEDAIKLAALQCSASSAKISVNKLNALSIKTGADNRIKWHGSNVQSPVFKPSFRSTPAASNGENMTH